LYVGQRLDGAAGLLDRPPAGTAWQWVVGVRLEQFELAEICCAPEYYVAGKQAHLMTLAMVPVAQRALW
jgi:hypothetical protein